MSAWQTKQLAEVATIERSALQPSQIKSGTTYVGLEHIESGGAFLDPKPVDVGTLASSKFQFTDRHVLYGKLRPYLAKIACPNFSGICSTDILPILPGLKLERRFLYHYLRQPLMVDYANSRAVGVNLPRLSPSVLAKIEIPLPPLAEQRRIAAVLDLAEALRAKRRASLAQLDALTQAIFFDMFGDAGDNPKRWPVKPVHAYVADFQGGKSIAEESGENVLTKNRVLKVSAVTGMKFRPNESKPVSDSYEPPIEHFVRPDDLLFSRANTTELVGAVAYVEHTPPNVLLPDKIWRFVWRKPVIVEPLFVWTLFQTIALRREIGRRATGTSGSMKNISQEKVFGISTILPPLALQREFARRVSTVDKLKAAHRTSLAEMDTLFASLQHRAFRGEL